MNKWIGSNYVLKTKVLNAKKTMPKSKNGKQKFGKLFMRKWYKNLEKILKNFEKSLKCQCNSSSIIWWLQFAKELICNMILWKSVAINQSSCETFNQSPFN